jgi:predicted nucleic acid-binding protein
MRRIFVDANVLIAGTDSQSGASNAVLKLAEVGLFQLVVCTQVLDEVERNLRKKLPRALPNFAAQMARLRLEILPDPTQEQVKPWQDIIEAKDASILCAAVASHADRFITLNTKFLRQRLPSRAG